MKRGQNSIDSSNGKLEAIGYVRVSTVEQADSGLSLEAQRARIKAQAKANGWRLIEIHEDAGLSAKTLDRPGLQAALGELGPGRVLVALKLDRLTRSVLDLAELVQRIEGAQAEWATITEKFDTTTATGRLMLGMMVQLSQWEREVIAERTSAALAQKRVRRERVGTTPLGYRTTREEDGTTTLEVDPVGQETVRLARALRSEGCSLQTIARRMREMGRPTARGGAWHASTVEQLLKPRYVEEILRSDAGVGGGDHV